MLATIPEGTWNMLKLQHITPNSKWLDYWDIPGGGHKKVKGPAQGSCRKVLKLKVLKKHKYLFYIMGRVINPLYAELFLRNISF